MTYMTMTGPQTVLLRPRPLAREPSAFPLLPLLPKPLSPIHLPVELWTHILHFVVRENSVELERFELEDRREVICKHCQLLFVCRGWREVARPLLYTNVYIFTLSSLGKFVSVLHIADQKWDSIRRIPYSTPGRWVQSLDVSAVRSSIPSHAIAIDSLLTTLFPLLPFLEKLMLCQDHTLSKLALASLRFKDGLERLRSLKGFKVTFQQDDWHYPDTSHSALELLARCEYIEQLELVNDAGPQADHTVMFGLEDPAIFTSFPGPHLHLPHLTFLYLHTPSPTPLIAALLRTPLPSLLHLMITPYNDSPSPCIYSILAAHGNNLVTLHFNSPKHWPTTLGPHPSTILSTSPHLRHLSLDYPLPMLAVPAGTQHPLQVLTIPRPNARFLYELEALLPRLPSLAVVRARNVRWLRSGVAGKALEAGTQGDMHDWRRRLARRKIRLVDSEWKDPT